MPRELTDHDETPIITACTEAAKGDVKHIILDFSAVERMNGLGASMLVKLTARVKKLGLHLSTFGLDRHYHDVFTVTGLNRAIRIYDSEAQALTAAGETSDVAEPAAPPRQAESLDKANWAKPVSKLKVPEMPAEAVNLNVDGLRAVGPIEGFGQMWQKMYRQHLTNSHIPPADVIKFLKENFPKLQPPENHFYPSAAGIQPGEIILINASTPGGPIHTGVMVLYADEESFTFITPQGHPESGWVSFSSFEEEGATVVQILGLARANDPIYEIGFRLVGSKVQERIWRYVLSSTATYMSAKPDVELRKICPDKGLQWSGVKNIWYNAQIRSSMYTLLAPIRWIRKLAR